MRYGLLLLVLLPAAPAWLHAQRGEPHAPNATAIRASSLYIQADTATDKLGTIEPGRELAILERSGHWLRVYANIDTETVRTEDQPTFGAESAEPPISGWVQDDAIVAADAPDAQQILFGEAISYEDAATQPHPLAGAAQNARRLYRMAAELFPKGERTAEAMWRSADIRWQLQKQDAATLPSAHEKESYLRQQPDEGELHLILKLYPGSKWASFAAYDLLDNKLCGDWAGSERCPEEEARSYAGFADHYPESPRATGALFEAAWRLACAGDMWQADGHTDRATADRKDAVATARHLAERYAATDDAARAMGLVYKVEHGIPLYGSDRK